MRAARGRAVTRASKGSSDLMKKNVVNLDALILREDYEAENPAESPYSESIRAISITQLSKGEVWFVSLRKPDFQRETASWSPDKVTDLIETFINGDLIPAAIMWHSKGNNFVIDGCHRLSALIAWVLDDYGDRETSQQFFKFKISPEQERAATKTRDLVKDRVGTYAELQAALKDQTKANPKIVERAKRLAVLGLPIQWIPGQDAKKAENSFFKINQAAEAIEPTELRLLLMRTTPNALAARAIVRAGTGHKYWARFPQEKQTAIETLAADIHNSLFMPPLATPIKTLDLPIAGKGYASLPLIFDTVNIIQPVPEGTKPAADTSGEATIQCLQKVQRVIQRISGEHASSLGLHPAVYFYGTNGRYQQTAFLATISLFRTFEANNYFKEFTLLRNAFEEFLLQHKNFINDVTVKFGSGTKGYAPLESLYRLILEQFENKQSDAEIEKTIHDDGRFPYLVFDAGKGITKSTKFGSDTKSAIALKTLLASAPRCKICDARLHVKSYNFDHIVKKEHGGIGAASNAQLTHFFCNSTIKN